MLNAWTEPVSSSPSGVLANDDAAEIRTCLAVPFVLETVRFVTATLASVMNLVCTTRRPCAVLLNVLRQ
ncbi:hypothetical protein D3C74_447490 [compost metagenome]